MSDATQTFPQQAYAYVKGRILNRHYRPGEVLTDAGIAAELGISRTPVREAFGRLQNEGLLVYEARRGWKVYSLSLHDVQEIFDLKESVEGMVARQAAACADEPRREALRAALTAMDDAARAGDAPAWLRADETLHDALYAMAGNERARRVVLNLNDQWHRLRIGFTTLEGRMSRSAGEHAAMVEAVLAGDADAAERRMRAHLRNVRDELTRVLAELVMPFAREGV